MSIDATHVKWATYVDGFNFYRAVKDRLPDDELYLGWCDFATLSERIIADRGELVAIRYFTASVEDFPKDDEEPQRQATWLRAVKTTRKLSIVEGFFVGQRTGSATTQRAEKATDVNIAISLVLDAAKQVYDKAILITGDYDQFPAVVAVADELYKNVEVWIPPGQDLAKWQKFNRHPRIRVNRLTVDLLRQSRLPDALSDAEGPIEPPPEWRSRP